MKINIRKLIKGAMICSEVVGMANVVLFALFVVIVSADKMDYRLAAGILFVCVSINKGMFDVRYNQITRAVEKRLYGKMISKSVNYRTTQKYKENT